MGIPIILPSPPSTRTVSHSAKASWSALQGPSLAIDDSTSSSSSSSSSPSPSHLYSRPPLSSLAYVPPPPSIWGSSSSSLSPSPTRIAQSPTSFTSPSGRVEAQDSIPINPTQQGDRNTLDTRSLLSSLENMRSPPPRVRAHPNLRRISRVPVFITSSSLPTTLASSSTGRTSTRPSSGSEPPSNQDGSRPSSAPRQDQPLESNGTSPPTVPRPVWNPTSPSMVHYLTRPLPPPPSSSSLLSVQRGPEHTEEGFSGGHYINRNHPANIGRMYLDEVGRLAVDPRFRPSRQEDQEEDEGDSDQRRSFDHRSRSRPRPRERRRPTILTTDSAPRSSLTPPLSTLLPYTTTSPSSAPPRTPLSSYPAIQDYLGSRTTIQADAFQQGLIHIYSDDHDPILMFGRPILSSTEPSDYSSGRSHHSPTTALATTPLMSSNNNDMPTSTSSRSPSLSNITSTPPAETTPHPSNH